MTEHFMQRRPATTLRAPLAPRAARLGAAAVAALSVAGCSNWSASNNAGGYRVGDTPNYATSSIPQAARSSLGGRVETGIAAWNGDISAPGLSAAHLSLPIGTWARVTNVSSGKSATVHIGERLAPGSGRAIELSRDAAAAVDALHNGLVTVLIEPLDPRQTTPQDRQWVRAQPTQPIPPAPRVAAPAPSSGVAYDPNLATGSIPRQQSAPAPSAPSRSVVGQGLAGQVIGSSYLQLGAFKDSKNAHRLLSRLGNEGMTRGAYGDGFVETAYVNGQIWHRVRLGPLENAAEAGRALKDARALGHNTARLVRP